MSGPLIYKDHEFKVGPRKGITERRLPYRYTDGFFRVYDPNSNLKFNTDANATKVSTLAEVAHYVRQGYGLRMTGPHTPSPSLCSAKYIVVED
ncbi:MAG: hypothetical protein ACK4RT_02245 [Erythrobacter sp.]